MCENCPRREIRPPGRRAPGSANSGAWRAAYWIIVAFSRFGARPTHGTGARRPVRELPAQGNSPARPPRARQRRLWRMAGCVVNRQFLHTPKIFSHSCLADSELQPVPCAHPPLVEACAKIARVKKCNRQFLHSPKTCHFIPELSTADFRLQAEWKGRCHKHARVAGVILGWR